MDVPPGLLGATVWTIVLAAPFRRFRRSSTPLRATVIASVLLFVLRGVSDWSRNYDLREAFSSEGSILTAAAGGALVAFLFYEWRDRARS